MAAKGPLSSEERLQIIELLKRGNLSHRAISRQFSRSQSTISSIAKDAGITPTHRRKRTPAARDVESTYNEEERVHFVDRIIGVLDGMVSDGGLTPRDMKELTTAAKAALDARRSEDVEPTEEGEKEEEMLPLFGEMKVPKNSYIGKELEEVERDLEERAAPGEFDHLPTDEEVARMNQRD